jgi:hydrogenase maturation factor HypF (carbamoyltransferase family)
MILVYEFEYISKNSVLENFLQALAVKDGIEHYITKVKDKISLYARGDEERLIAFSDDLSSSLPFSVFLKSTSVNVTNEWDDSKAVKAQDCKIYIPFTKQALKRAKNEFNPFVKNEIGQNLDINPPLVFANNGKTDLYESNFKEAFHKAADIIASGEKINFKTLKGTFCISEVKDKSYQSDILVMPSDLSLVGKIAVMEDVEAATLASLEKPIIKAHTNMVFSLQYPNFPKFIRLKLADDLFLYFLSLALFEKGVKFVVLEAEECASAASLYFKDEVKKDAWFEICHLKNGQNIILKGTSFTSPQLLKSIKQIKNPHHMQFAATIQELNLFEEADCGIYLSLENDDMIMFYSAQAGVLDMVNITYENSLAQMLENIAKKDETSAKLIKNYTEKFPLIIAKTKEISLKTKNIANLWSAAAFLMGLGDSLEEAQERLLENIVTFGGQKGPRVDYKLLDEESVKTTIDAHKFIKSVMSFRLAGVDDGLLSYGISESLVHFLSDFADKIKDEFEVKNILLMGSMFGIKTISNLCVKHLSVSHKVHFNKELPIEL